MNSSLYVLRFMPEFYACMTSATGCAAAAYLPVTARIVTIIMNFTCLKDRRNDVSPAIVELVSSSLSNQ